MDRAAFLNEARSLGLELSKGQADLFELFERELYAANEHRNLTRVPREQCALRHFTDSLLHHRMIPYGAAVLDIGTGPGFPAWPLACARPDLHVVALDSSSKMISFLNQVPLENLTTMRMRAEDWDQGESFDVVTGRAVAPLATQLEISSAPCRIGGAVVPMRTRQETRSLPRQIPALGLSLEGIELVSHHALGDRAFPIYRKIARVAAGYPRPWAQIVKQPLWRAADPP